MSSFKKRGHLRGGGEKDGEEKILKILEESAEKAQTRYELSSKCRSVVPGICQLKRETKEAIGY